MKHKRLTPIQRILLNRMTYRRHVSEEFLRFAKQKAEETQKAVLLAQEAYNRQHGTHHQISSERERD